MPKRNLTDRTLKALKASKPGTHYDVMDATVSGFGVRISATGRRTFILVARYGSNNPTRRALGEYGAISLAAARQKAQAWHGLIKRGIDPRDQERRERAAEAQKRANTFAAVAEDFIRDKLPGERKGREVEQDLRREFIPAWGARPITDIASTDIRSLIKAKAVTAPAQARNLLGHAKRLFSWAVEQEVYGLTESPCERLKPGKIIGDKVAGNRVLSDDEMFALWRAAGRLGYPYGTVYRLLLLTALRLNEAADAAWPEFDLANALWVIPRTRMKGTNGRARSHAVPLTSGILAILEQLPRFKTGSFLFSTTLGRQPVWMGSRPKKRLDARMLRTLRALARRRGADPATVKLEHWRNHDIRRSVRSNLSRLRITEEAREAVLGHVRPGIKGVYDLHDYLPEKTEALELWAARLREIIMPPPPNVIALARGRAQ